MSEKRTTVEFGMDVKNVVIKDENGKKVATQIVYEKDGKTDTIDLVEDDLVFITNGCCTDTSCYGDQNTAPDLSNIKNGEGESWDLWKNIAAQATLRLLSVFPREMSRVKRSVWSSALKILTQMDSRRAQPIMLSGIGLKRSTATG